MHQEIEKIKNFNGWFTSSLPLETIGEILQKSSLIRKFEYDYENIYEWLEVTLNDVHCFNLSRQHNNFENFEEENIGILLGFHEKEPDDKILSDFAQTISSAFGCPVFLGFIHHIEGDRYEYEKISEILPENAKNNH